MARRDTDPESAPAGRRRRSVWVVPVVTAALVAAGAVGLEAAQPNSAFADAHPNLPAKTAAQLLAAVRTSSVTALSGTVTETANLGLPSLPSTDTGGDLSVQTLLAGTHTARVWVDGPQKQRIALLGQLAETDVVHNGRDLWTYSSQTGKAAHTVLPSDTGTGAKEAPSTAEQLTPQAAAQKALAAIDPTTKVTVDRTLRVAGRSAYALVLQPRDSRSTISRISIAVDSATSVPLRVQVYGSAAAPALQTGFSTVSFSTPAASTFDFTPPRDASVSTHTMTQKPGPHPQTSTAGTSVIGSGWTSVLKVPSGTVSPPSGSSSSSSSSALGLLNQASQPIGTKGDRLISTNLVNALITPNGQMYVGAVTPTVLQQAEAGR